MLCGNLDGWHWVGVGGRSQKEGIPAYIQLIHFAVQRKLTQQGKAIILQLKAKKKTNKWKTLVQYLTPRKWSVNITYRSFFHHSSIQSSHLCLLPEAFLQCSAYTKSKDDRRILILINTQAGADSHSPLSENVFFIAKSSLQFLSTCDEIGCEGIYKYFDLHNGNSISIATWREDQNHWKRPYCWERLRARGEGGDRGWDGWMASLTQWTWV